MSGSKTQFAVEWLHEYIEAAGGEARKKTILEAGQLAGYSIEELESAKLLDHSIITELGEDGSRWRHGFKGSYIEYKRLHRQ